MLDERVDNEFRDTDSTNYSDEESYTASGTDAAEQPANSDMGTASASASGSTGSGQPDASHSSHSVRGYYSYDRSGRDSREQVSSAYRNRKERKSGGRIAVVLAVVLVFILGAGIGSYVSGRTAAASLQDSVRSAQSPSASAAESGSADSDKTKEKDKSSEQGTQTGDSSSGGGTIARVQDRTAGTALGDTTVADVAESVMPAIVSVYNKYTEQSQFFGRTYTQEAESAGSGIIIEESDGELLIVTNNHVVEGADSLSVQFINEENCEAALKGTDVSSDLAVISVSLSDLNTETKDSIAVAELGDSDSLRIGEQAIAIGNALGYGQSLTVGYISALNREMTSENGITGTFIQTDAAINPGNSGGALLNSRGQVIGINSNKIGGSAVEGMGFAIPISKAIPIIDSLKTQESRTKVAEEEQGVLGIYGISVTSDVASAYGLPVGAYVEELIEGGGAAKSDLKQGYIITAINGQTITGMEDLQRQMAYFKAGEEVTLTVQHPMEGGEYEEREIKVTLSERSSIEESNEDSHGRGEQQQNMFPEEEESGNKVED